MSGPERSASSAIVVGAGQGTRFGAADKVLAPVAGRPLLAWALDAAQGASSVEAIVLVVGAHIRPAVLELVAMADWTKLVAVVDGGERRQDSVAAGLAAVPVGTQLVAIHDAARPLATPELFDACLAAAAEHGAAIAAVPIADTLKRVEGGRIVATIPREGIWAAQTPQAFRVDLLRQGFAHAAQLGLDVTDEAVLIEATGGTVAIVPGSAANLKVTRRSDLALATALVRAVLVRKVTAP